MNNVIVVASGKGGTGKSTVCICLSVSLVKQGKRVLLIDCDCGMRGLDIMLDIEQDILFDASDAVCGNCAFGEAVYKSKNNDKARRRDYGFRSQQTEDRYRFRSI